MCCNVKYCNCHVILAVDMAGVACRGLHVVCVCMCACGWRNGEGYRDDNFVRV